MTQWAYKNVAIKVVSIINYNKLMDKDIKELIIKWLIDFEATRLGNVTDDDDTFEGSAYNIFNSIIAEEE